MAVLWVLWLVMATVALGLLEACGGSGGAAANPRITQLHGDRTGFLAGELARLEGLRAPEGVDDALWRKLKQALAAAAQQESSRSTASPYNQPVDDLREDSSVSLPQIGVTWTNAFFRGDGNGDGIVSIADLTPLAVYFSETVMSNPNADVADYNHDGMVSIADITPLAAHLGDDVAAFRVEVSTSSPTGGFHSEAVLDFSEHEAEPNSHGFYVYRHILSDAYEAELVWVRVIPQDAFGADGSLPAQPLELVYTRPLPEGSVISGVRFLIAGSVNTDDGSGLLGTDSYPALAEGEETSGDSAANLPVLVGLGEVSLSVPGEGDYGFGEIPAWYAFGCDSLLRELMQATEIEVTSTREPPDPQAFTELSLGGVDRGVIGVVSPNHPQELMVGITVAGGEATGGESFGTLVRLSVVDDVTAPRVLSFSPQEIPQGADAIVEVRINFGDDETGEEIPGRVRLLEASTLAIAAELVPAQPVETDTPPAGQFGVQRLAEPDENGATMRVFAHLTPTLAVGSYRWQVAEEVSGDFPGRASNGLDSELADFVVVP